MCVWGGGGVGGYAGKYLFPRCCILITVMLINGTGTGTEKVES